MVQYCSAYNCKSKAGDGYSFHKFPEDKKLRSAWCRALRRENFNVTKHSKICSKHFTKDNFEEERTGFNWLKKDVVPSIFDFPSNIGPSPKAQQKKPMKRQKSPQETESMPTCVSIGCSNRPGEKIPGISFHRFPKNLQLREAWIKACRKENWMPSSVSILCSEHFSEEQIDRTSLTAVRLRENAVPHIFKAFPFYLQREQIKKEIPWEEEYSFAGDSSSNNIRVKITNVQSVASSENVTCVSSEKIRPCSGESSSSNGNVEKISPQKVSPCSDESSSSNGNVEKISPQKVAKKNESSDSTFYKKPLKIDKREESFGKFVACEMSDLRVNAELYLKTQQSILKLLVEAHFEQMSSSNEA